MTIYKNDLDDLTVVTKALSDPQRVRILSALKNRELCLCQIVELLQLAQSTVSKHCSILKQAGLVESRKEERWMYFKLPEHPSLEVQNVLEWTLQTARSTERIKSDNKKLKKITGVPKEKICQNQKN
jgi:DNA-binding transcriptional ArsR family regulator